MTSTSRRPPEREAADPWWGFDEPAKQSAPAPASTATRRRARGRAARSSQRGLAARIGWLLVGVLVAPIDLLRRMLARSPRLRRLAIRAAVVLAVLTVLACSVGVILINNLVIGRTAELGELDDRRRELRRDNALLGAKAARLSSPDVVFRRATKELGMVRTEEVPQFIWLVPGSHELTPLQRRRVAAVAQRQRQAAQAAAIAPGDAKAAAATATPKAGDAAAKTSGTAPATASTAPTAGGTE